MSTIPPGHLPPTGPLGAQSSDAGANALMGYIQSLIGNPDPDLSHFGSLVNGYIQQQLGTTPNPSGLQVLGWIQHSIDFMHDLVYPSAPSTDRPDIYMVFMAQGWMASPDTNWLQANISYQVQNIEQQYGIQCPFNVPNIGNSDPSYLNMLNWINGSWHGQQASPTMAKLLHNIMNEMLTDPNAGSWEQGAFTIWDYVTNLFSDPNFFTNYNNPPITWADIQNLLYVPPPTSDEWPMLPGISYVNPSNYEVPDYFQAYLTLGYSIASESGPLQKLNEALLGQMVSGLGQWQEQGYNMVWVMSSNSQLQTWLFNTICSPQFLSTYSGITADEISTVAQEVGLALPSSFPTYFNAMMALLPSDPTSANYKMIMDFQSKWIAALFANPTTWNATTWFEATFAAPGSMSPPYPAGMDDLYMLYSLADIGVIQSMVDIFVPGTTTYTPTAWDTTYRTIFAAHGSDTSGIYFDFFKECRTVGSSDTGQAIEIWIDNFALGGFSQYPTMKPQDVMNFLANFNLVTTIGGSQVSYVCDFITNYVQTVWMPGKTGSDKQFGQQLINQLVGWVGTEAPPGKLSDLQTFITSQHYTTKYPSSAADITALLAMFGLTP